MLRLQNISKQYKDFSLKNISFNVNKGDYFILLGESGAGKSIILETIAGLISPDSGSIMLDEKDITKEKIQHRGIGLVFQDHAVFPHYSVGENIAYPLHGLSLKPEVRKREVLTIAKQLSIDNLLQRRPDSLSGGELQRVALARTLIQKPRVLLLDEPLASMDSLLKAELRTLLRNIHRNGQTMLHVTHDYEEALSLGSRIAVINNGEIVQEGTPTEVFQNPRSEFVAHFIGVKNFFPAKIIVENGLTFAQINDSMRVRLITDSLQETGFLMILGEDILLSKSSIETSSVNNWQGEVVEVVPTARGIDVAIDIGMTIHALITPESLARLEIAEGKNCWIHIKATAVRFIKS